MKSTNSASKEYFKFVLITAPLFAVVLLLVDIGWASRSLDQIKSQHNRDIANNMQLARRIIAPLIEDNSSSDTLLNEISSILVNFSRVPGVGCVELKGPELQIIHPPQDFCDVIPKSALESVKVDRANELIFHLDDRYTTERENEERNRAILFTLIIAFTFIVLNYFGYIFVFRYQIDRLTAQRQRLLDDYPVPTVTIDRNGVIDETSNSWIEQVQWTNQNTNFYDYVSDADRTEVKKTFQQAFHKSEGGTLDHVRIYTNQGEQIHSSLKYSHSSHSRGDYLLVSAYNLNATYQLVADKTYEARTDMLTGALTRRALNEDTHKDLFSNIIYHFALFDIDNFKSVNDLYGYSKGDEVIQKMANHLMHFAGPDSHVYRLGGEEFLVCTPATNKTDWAKIQQKFAMIEFSNELENFFCTVSVGLFDQNDQTAFSAILKKLNNLVALAKSAGGNCIYSLNTSTAIVHDVHEPSIVLSALENGEFVFAFEIIKDIQKDEPFGVEALIRWNTNGAFLKPASFIKSYYLATRNLDLGALRHKNFINNIRLKLPEFRGYITYNIALEDLIAGRHQVLINTLKPLLKSHRIILELSEQQFERRMSIKDVKNIFNTLRGSGYLIALDDFGKESSNLNRFVEMPIDILKIDMGLTRNIHLDNKRKTVIQSLVGLCAKFNITLIAEGVETEEDREVLAEIGVTNLQGYLYGELNMSH